MKRLRLQILRDRSRKSFRIHLLGLHEPMPPCIVNRPQGTGDYLFMLFHSPVRIRSGGREQDWPSSTMMVWTPKDGHFYGQAADDWDHSWFHCGGQAIARIVQQSRLPVGRPFAVTDPSLLERYLLDTVAELNGWHGADEVTLRNLFENYARAQARQLLEQPRQLAPARLLAVRAEVENRFTEKLPLPELAKSAGWSVPHLCAEFRRFFGVPVQRYAQQLRLNQAAYLLRDRNRRIGEIAQHVGYPDLYTFSKMFKRAFGLSPRAFRLKNS